MKLIWISSSVVTIATNTYNTTLSTFLHTRETRIREVRPILMNKNDFLSFFTNRQGIHVGVQHNFRM